MSQPNHRDTKIYVAGLAWVTKTEGLRSYFEQFGEIDDANVVCEIKTGRSRGFGFVTFREAESATRACENPNPIIDERVASCKLAYLGARVHNSQSNQNDQPLAIYVEPYWYQYYSQYCQYYPWFSAYPY